MNINIQPILENEKVILYPLQEMDFDDLYNVASDPEIWEQHPNKDRWRKDIFSIFFEGAIQSKGAFKIIDKATGNIAGSCRYYNFNDKESSISIGYTFYAKSYWGAGFNPLVKALMLDYIFQFVSKVYFHIGANNFRSQVAIVRIGAEKIAETVIAYYGEPEQLNFIYEVSKQKWERRKM
ncbi:MAG: GNAT family N-acetyltransferase [Flavitalea sp.]